MKNIINETLAGNFPVVNFITLTGQSASNFAELQTKLVKNNSFYFTIKNLISNY